MFELKRLSHEAIPRALEKALRYRLLNEPVEAASICRDILKLEPENQKVLVTLVLALTDQIAASKQGVVKEARDIIDRLSGEYERLYYTGILHERWAKACYRRGTPGCGPPTYDSLRQAMECFEKAAVLAPPDNEESLLRWNACARFIMEHDGVAPAPEVAFQPMLE